MTILRQMFDFVSQSGYQDLNFRREDKEIISFENRFEIVSLLVSISDMTLDTYAIEFIESQAAVDPLRISAYLMGVISVHKKLSGQLPTTCIYLYRHRLLLLCLYHKMQ